MHRVGITSAVDRFLQRLAGQFQGLLSRRGTLFDQAVPCVAVSRTEAQGSDEVLSMHGLLTNGNIVEAFLMVSGRLRDVEHYGSLLEEHTAPMPSPHLFTMVRMMFEAIADEHMDISSIQVNLEGETRQEMAHIWLLRTLPAIDRLYGYWNRQVRDMKHLDVLLYQMERQMASICGLLSEKANIGVINASPKDLTAKQRAMEMSAGTRSGAIGTAPLLVAA